MATALESLRLALLDPSWPVRRAAALALSRRGHLAVALPCLVDALCSSDAHLRRSAYTVLVQVGPALRAHRAEVGRRLAHAPPETQYAWWALRLRLDPTPEALAEAILGTDPELVELPAWAHHGALLAWRLVTRALPHERRAISSLVQAGFDALPSHQREWTALRLANLDPGGPCTEQFFAAQIRLRDPKNARAAALGLERVGPRSPETADILLEATSDPSPIVRAEALRALAAMPPLSEVCLGLLTKLIADADHEVRYRAARVVVRCQPSPARGALLRAMLKSEDANLRLQAIAGLGGKHPVPAEDLLPLLSDPVSCVRERALAALTPVLGALGERGQVIVEQMLDDRDVSVRVSAVEAAGQVGASVERLARGLMRVALRGDYAFFAATTTLARAGQLTQAPFGTLMQARGWDASAARHLRQLMGLEPGATRANEPGCPIPMGTLVASLGDARAEVRAQAEATLLAHPLPASLALVEGMEQQLPKMVQRRCRVLASLTAVAPGVRPALTRALLHPSTRVRAAACTATGRHFPGLWLAVAMCLSDRNMRVRAAAARALGR